MTTMMQPDAVVCPSCSHRVYDDWYPRGLEPAQFPKRNLEWWSDGEIISQYQPPLRSLVACPNCWAIIPLFAIKKALELKIDGIAIDSKYPFLPGHGGKNLVNADDVWPQFQSCNFKNWRMANSAMFSTQDPIFQFLILESVVLSFNDRVRVKARVGHKSGIFGDVSAEKITRHFLSKLEDKSLRADAYSDAFGCNVGDFVGRVRFNLLAAEVARYFWKFELATSFLSDAQALLSDESVWGPQDPDPNVINDNEWQQVDKPLEFSGGGPMNSNWLKIDVLIKISRLSDRIWNSDGDLVLCNSLPGSHQEASRLKLSRD